MKKGGKRGSRNRKKGDVAVFIRTCRAECYLHHPGAMPRITGFMPRAQRGFFLSVDLKNRLCPSVRRPSVRASVPHFLIVILQVFNSYLEIDEIVAFPIRSMLQVCGPLLI